MPCPASTKLMRRSTSGQGSAFVTALPVVLVPYSPTRVALVIGSSVNGGYLLSLRVADSTDVGILIPLNNPPLILNLGDHGEMVRGPLYARSADINETIYYWDSHLPEQLD